MRIIQIAVLGIIAFSFLASLYYHPQMPDPMVTHWDARFEPDGYMGRGWGLLLIPLMMAGLFLLFLAIPRIDPLKKNIERFRGYFDNFVLLIFAFLAFVHLVMILWNVGIAVDFAVFLPLWLGVLFFYVGVLCKHSKKNWFIGVRTPWTMSSDIVWEKTNKRAGIMFQIAGLLMLAGMLLPRFLMLIVLGPILFLMVYITAYSYFEYQKAEKNRQQ